MGVTARKRSKEDPSKESYLGNCRSISNTNLVAKIQKRQSRFN